MIRDRALAGQGSVFLHLASRQSGLNHAGCGIRLDLRGRSIRFTSDQCHAEWPVQAILML